MFSFDEISQQEKKILSLFDRRVVELFQTDTVTDINYNSNGSIFVKDALKGKYKFDTYKGSLSPLINFIADHNDLVVNEKDPKLETSFLGMRITAIIPSMTDKALMAIRKPNYRIIELDEHVQKGTLSKNYYKYIVENFIEADIPKNFIITGPTGSGKTTFTNSVIHELTKLGDVADRIVSIEDTPELVIKVEDLVNLFQTSNVSLAKCLEGSLRLSPDRIFVGEVRSHAVIDMLNCWNTGHHGGVATMHTNNAKDTIQRIISLGSKHFDLEELYILMATTIGAIVSLREINGKKVVTEIVEVKGYDRVKKEMILEVIPK